ncbi:MAG TPA: methyltransferase domain-containing protein [Noviherbaspirillum sp.]|nr:methyltransferase domain-containing protein [Noviherbaspirillum sp.]
MPTFETRDPSAPDFWSERFKQEFMPWDRGDVPAQLRQFVTQSARPYVTLIPGCGTGYEVACLSEAGWNVTAIDFSAAAVELAKKVLGRWSERVQQADFFDFVPAQQVELIYERAFFCALPKRMRPAIVARWAELLQPGGLLAGFFFFDENPKGPPFGISPAELETLLTPFFERIVDDAVADSLPVFAGKERWQVWQRRPG